MRCMKAAAVDALCGHRGSWHENPHDANEPACTSACYVLYRQTVTATPAALETTARMMLL